MVAARKNSRFNDPPEKIAFNVRGPLGHIFICLCIKNNTKYSNSGFVERMTVQISIGS